MARFDFNKFWEQIRPKNVEQKITNFSAGNVPMILVGFAGVTVVALGIMVSLNNKEDSEDKDSDGDDKGDSQPDTEEEEEQQEQPDADADADAGVTTEQETTENAAFPNSENVTESEEDTNLVPTPEDVMKNVTGDGNEETDQKYEKKEYDAFASFGGDNKRRSKRRRKKRKHRKSKRRHRKKRNFKKNFL
jgi:hypothetical protein